MGSMIWCVPGMGACGGVRVILETCTRLKARGHDVTIVNPSSDSPSTWAWYGDIDVPVVRSLQNQSEYPDIVVATGAQTVFWARSIPCEKRFYFVQMMEHMFCKPGSGQYYGMVLSYPTAYRSGFEVVTIAEWLRDMLQSEWKIPSVIVPNGVNQEHFHPEGKKHNYILVEGDDRNQAKDIRGISWRVGAALREKYNVDLRGFAAIPHRYRELLDHFVVKPDVATMRRLYAGALFLLKASRFEGRACGPVEAMCCGTTTVRGLTYGDDDLIDGNNCLRTDYDYDKVLKQAERLMEDERLRKRLERNGLKYARTNLNWDKIIDRLEKVYGLS